MCNAEIVLVDGGDPNVVRVSSVQVELADVWNAPDSADPVSISVDEIVAGKFPDNARVATVAVVDADGKLGEFGRLGHSVTMASAPDALGLKGLGRRRAADGKFEWELVMKPGGAKALDGATNKEVKLTFTVVDNYEACCLNSGAECPNCPADKSQLQSSRTYTKVVPVVSAQVAATTVGERLGEVLLTAYDGDVDKATSKKASAVRVPFQYDNKTPLKAVFKVDIGEDPDRLFGIEVAAVKLDVCAAGAAEEDKVKLTQSGSGFIAQSSGGIVMCEVTAADAVGFVGTHNKDKLNQLELQPAPVGTPVAPTYEVKVNDVYFKVSHQGATGDEDVYWKLDIVFDDACSRAACEGGKLCSVCTSSGISGPAPPTGVECANVFQQTKGFTCDAVVDVAARTKLFEADKKAKKVAMDKAEDALKDADAEVAGCTEDCEAKATDAAVKRLAFNDAKKAHADAVADHKAAASSGSNGGGDATTTVGVDSAANKNGDDKDDGNTSMIIGIVVALVVCFVLALLVVLFLMSKNQTKKREAAQAQFDHYSSVENTLFDGAKGGKFQPGVTNPLYDWYHPKMSAAVARKFLESKHDGAFIIRDSEQTNGWHKLCVKSQGKVINDNIKQTHSGQYELVAGEEQQPKFRSLPDMVTHYSKRQAGSPYMLAAEGADDAPYDMSDGPAVPQKGAQSLGNPMYGAGAGMDLSSGSAYGADPSPYGGDAYGDAHGANA